jgi:hypothetical protein
MYRTFLNNAISIVSILTLPMNMVIMITSLLALLSSLVMPRLKPTVLYAEKHSKAIRIKSLSLSNDDIKKTAAPITIRDKEMMAKALLTDTSAISLPKYSMRSLPLARLIKFKMPMENVLVLIPPPVEAGDAPIHINRKTNIMVQKFNTDVSTELKPAVLGVTAPKKAVTTLPKPWCSARVLSYSKK